MTTTRRDFLKTAAMGFAGASLAPAVLRAAQGGTPTPTKIRLGARLGSLGGKLEVAGRCGLDGVELAVGPRAPMLQIAEPATRQTYKEQVKALGLVVASLSMDLLNGNPMATDPLAPAWVAQTIDAAKDLGAVAILVPFFGKAALEDGGKLKKADVDALVGRMKDLAPRAKAAGVTLGLENTLSAQQDLEILDRIGSDAVAVYYDIGNAAHYGHDAVAEIPQLKGRICQFHFKDNPHYLGEGDIKWAPVAEAIHAIAYQGWIVLETNCPSKDGAADCKRNAAFVRKLLGLPPK